MALVTAAASGCSALLDVGALSASAGDAAGGAGPGDDDGAGGSGGGGEGSAGEGSAGDDAIVTSSDGAQGEAGDDTGALDAGSREAGDTGPPACPSTGRGPTMVRAGAFCIDGTEVTRTQYAAFLTSLPSTAGQPARCAWNTTFTPQSAWPPGSLGDDPVVGVDWCDAWAFCAWAGKRLCGAVGGGAVDPGSFADAAASQWTSACTLGGAHPYPYGDTYVGTACNGEPTDGAATLVPVATFTACQSYAGVYDLLGNADEWEDSCTIVADDAGGANDTCHLRGEGFGEGTALVCNAPEAHARSAVGGDQGIRCCAP